MPQEDSSKFPASETLEGKAVETNKSEVESNKRVYRSPPSDTRLRGGKSFSKFSRVPKKPRRLARRDEEAKHKDSTRKPPTAPSRHFSSSYIKKDFSRRGDNYVPQKQKEDKEDRAKDEKSHNSRGLLNLKNVPKGPRARNTKPWEKKAGHESDKPGSFSHRGKDRYVPNVGKKTKPNNDSSRASRAEPKKASKPLAKITYFETREFPIYERVAQVGEGTYGKVYKAKNKLTGELVALKRLRLEGEREGFPITAMREIRLLQSFDHVNVVGLLEMMIEKRSVYMVFDYIDNDLTGILNHPDVRLSAANCKYLFKQLTEGMEYLHSKRVIHRDIKGSNILIDGNGNIRIADFGLARRMKDVKEHESPNYTNRVITLWYRPPELLLGATDYGREVDIWGIGCLLVEIFNRKAIFQGSDEISQLQSIFELMGTPNMQTWPKMDNLPWFELLRPKTPIPNNFREKYGAILPTESCFLLAEKLLTMNPEHRISAKHALAEPFFSEEPLPESLDFLGKLGEWHELDAKKQRRKMRKEEAEKKKAQEVKEREFAEEVKPDDNVEEIKLDDNAEKKETDGRDFTNEDDGPPTGASY